MKIVYFGKGIRGYYCLEKILQAGYKVKLAVGPDNKNNKNKSDEFSILTLAERFGIKTITPAEPNSPETETFLRNQNADLFVLGGYGKILKKNIIAVPKIMTVNLHGGKLPANRGSSPLNWVLINGESSFTLSIIKVDGGVDTGPVLHETTHPIGPNDTIVDLHKIANDVFPQMLLHVLQQLKTGNYTLREQARHEGAYYPLRFPGDGFILFDQLTARQVH
ncbi:MAG: hypothetical protein GY950_20050, partial [bacterium]|nr:hypothetical protein [bacterium]